MKNLFLLPVLVAGLGLLAASTDYLYAATFSVTTTNISGLGSLPVAIAQANATPGKNQIQISVTNPITLGLMLPTITNSVAITGVAAVPTVISGGGTLPLFTFAAGTTNSLSNLVLANGYSTSSGAAISNASTLSVSSCNITNNITSQFGQVGTLYGAFFGTGGAIFNSGYMVVNSTIISSNQAYGIGGGIYNLGTMILNNSMLSGNWAQTNGGAIFNGGSLAITMSTLTNNLVRQQQYTYLLPHYNATGGGIYNTGVLSITRSTFVANSVIGTSVDSVTEAGDGYGGALFSVYGPVGITNSSFYQNSATGGNWGDNSEGGNGEGGAAFIASGTHNFVNCTIAGNTSKSGTNGPQRVGFAGGIYNSSGTVTLINTIIAGNSASNDRPDLYGTFVSSGVNLIGNNQGATGLSLYDFQNVAANLGPLQNNGGPTMTCAPLPGSYAIGYGTSTGAPTTDQRGVPRPQGGAFDIGAVQVGHRFTLCHRRRNGQRFRLHPEHDF